MTSHRSSSDDDAAAAAGAAEKTWPPRMRIRRSGAAIADIGGE